MTRVHERYIESPAVQELIGHDAIANPAPIEHMVYSADVDSDALEGHQNIRLGVAESTEPTSVILVPASWSDYESRPFQSLRLGTMAAYANARVIGLDLPGMGNIASPPDSLTERQSEELKAGRMKELANIYWKALEHDELLTAQDGSALKVSLWGNSLGTLTVEELALACPEGVFLQDVYISEPMALKKMVAGKLATRFLLRANKHMGDYSALNTGMPEHEGGTVLDLAHQASAQAKSHWQSVQALSRGLGGVIFEEAYQKGVFSNDAEHGTRVHIVTAQDGLSPEKAVGEFSKQVHDHGFRYNGNLQSRRILRGEGHGYQDALPTVLEQLSYLAIVEA